MTVYRFINNNSSDFGVRWLLCRFNLSPNAYYNYLKDKKLRYRVNKHHIYDEIKSIYHKYGGIIGHRSMQVFLSRKGIYISKTTVFKYMNKDLNLKAIVRHKKPNYKHGKAYEVFPNLLKQNFYANRINQKWCTDFTYLFLTDGSKRYNCSIIDLYDRSVVACINGKEITSSLAISALQKALDSQPAISGNLILHSDQGTQFTSKEFVNFCKSVNITQSMSKSGCPYDNAPMERYYNTLKTECVYQRYYHSDEELDASINEFAYVWYNHVRPHSFNNYKTPFEARYD